MVADLAAHQVEVSLAVAADLVADLVAAVSLAAAAEGAGKSSGKLGAGSLATNARIIIPTLRDQIPMFRCIRTTTVEQEVGSWKMEVFHVC